jgi:dehydrogenase/reductase SDR family member 7B
MARFHNQVIWITGASSGIGEALAKALAREGALLILSGRRLEALQAVAQACAPAPTFILPFEATSFDALPDVVGQAVAWQGRIDMLVNNAGVSQRSLAIDTQFEVYQRLFDIDVFAPIRLTQLLLPHMLKAGRGHIVAIASVAGKIGAPLRTGYCAAKHAVVGYFDALRAEVDCKGLQVSVVTPGFIRTAIASNAIAGDGSVRGTSDTDIDGGMDADACAAVIVNGLAKGRKEIPVGEGKEMAALWMKRFFPDRLFAMTARIGAKLMTGR